MRENPRTSFRICQKVFDENYQRKIGLGSIYRVIKNEKVRINSNTGIEPLITASYWLIFAEEKSAANESELNRRKPSNPPYTRLLSFKSRHRIDLSSFPKFGNGVFQASNDKYPPATR
jgi:hypothetical protein